MKLSKSLFGYQHQLSMASPLRRSVHLHIVVQLLVTSAIYPAVSSFSFFGALRK